MSPMIGLNHALTGAALASVLPLPAALPVAFASHFVLDALPHYGIEQHQRNTSQMWKVISGLDVILSLAFGVLTITSHHPALFWCGLVAVAPDFLWVSRIIRNRSFDLSDHGHWFTRWHADIQRYERPWGIWVELPFATALAYVVLHILW